MAYLFFTLVLLLNSVKWNFAGEIKYILVITPVLLGLVLEILQYLLTQSRQADIFDFMANICGIATGTVLLVLAKKIIKPGRA